MLMCVCSEGRNAGEGDQNSMMVQVPAVTLQALTNSACVASMNLRLSQDTDAQAESLLVKGSMAVF